MDPGMAPPKHGGMAMDSSMQMWFYWGKHVTLFFSRWTTSSLVEYLLSLVGVFVLAALNQLLSRIHKDESSNIFLRIVVFAVYISISYLLMLAVMSYNAGVFIVVVAGTTAGFFAFHMEHRRRLQHVAEEDDDKNAAA